MILYVFLILLLLLIFYLLVVPIILHVDTSTNQYYIQIGGIFKANFLYDEAELIKLKFKILGFNYEVFPLRKKPKSKPKNRIKENTDNAKKNALPFKKILRVIRSFEVKQFLIDIDTGDCITNSKLYPVFQGLIFIWAVRCSLIIKGEIDSC